MNTNLEVFNQTLELLDTLDEVLEHTSTLISEGKSEEGLEMLYNLLTGIESISNALRPCIEQLPANSILELETNMSGKFNKMVDIFKSNELLLLENYLDNNVLNAFNEWKAEIVRAIKPYTAS